MLLFLRQLFMLRVCVCVCVRVCVCVCVVHWHCSAQLSMFNMEKRYRNKIIIIIIITLLSSLQSTVVSLSYQSKCRSVRHTLNLSITHSKLPISVSKKS